MLKQALINLILEELTRAVHTDCFLWKIEETAGRIEILTASTLPAKQKASRLTIINKKAIYFQKGNIFCSILYTA